MTIIFNPADIAHEFLSVVEEQRYYCSYLIKKYVAQLVFGGRRYYAYIFSLRNIKEETEQILNERKKQQKKLLLTQVQAKIEKISWH